MLRHKSDCNIALTVQTLTVEHRYHPLHAGAFGKIGSSGAEDTAISIHSLKDWAVV